MGGREESRGIKESSERMRKVISLLVRNNKQTDTQETTHGRTKEIMAKPRCVYLVAITLQDKMLVLLPEAALITSMNHILGGSCFSPSPSAKAGVEGVGRLT